MAEIIAQLMPLWILLGLQTQPAAPSEKTERPAPSTKQTTTGESEIRIKEIPASIEVLLHHDGPYWTIGADVTRVKEQMVAASQNGPLFIRYLNNPLGMSSGKLRVVVGFKCSGSLVPPKGFERSKGSIRQAAVMTVQGRAPSIRRDYSRILSWIRKESLQDTGVVTEVYCGGRPPDCQPVNWELGPTFSEIRVSLKSKDQAVMSERTTPPGGRSEPIETALPIESTSKTNRSPEFSTPTTSAPLAPVPTESKATSYRAQQPSHVQPTPSGRPVARERVTDLLAKKDFTEIAKLLMPDEMMGSQQDQIWVTRLVMRIMAAADGIAQVFPNSSEQARQLHDALRNRHRQYTSRLHLNPTFLAMNAGNTGSSATRWRILLEETDDLLGAIAYQSVDSDQATLRLHAVIEKVAAQVEIAMRGE